MRSGSSSRAVSIRIGTSRARAHRRGRRRSRPCPGRPMSSMTIRTGWRSSSTSASSPRAHPDDAVAVVCEVAADELSDRRLVLDQQDRPGHGLRLWEPRHSDADGGAVVDPHRDRPEALPHHDRRPEAESSEGDQIVVGSERDGRRRSRRPREASVRCGDLGDRPRSRISVCGTPPILTLISACDQLPGRLGIGGGCGVFARRGGGRRQRQKSVQQSDRTSLRMTLE